METENNTISLNDTVRVELTELGKQVYTDWCTSLHSQPVFFDKHYYDGQLWELMQIFGPKIQIGFSTHFFVGNVIQVKAW